ncbi:hypothetical protein J1614_001363 [Plenodomus biglobosus]|nr:hypothetical protein J1614_001363 [Plenodomus biglobosus]
MAKRKAKDNKKDGVDKDKDKGLNDTSPGNQNEGMDDENTTEHEAGYETEGRPEAGHENEGHADINFKAPAATDAHINTNRGVFIRRLDDLEAEQTRDRTGLIPRIRQRDRLHYSSIQLRHYESSRPGLLASTAYRWRKYSDLRRLYAHYEDFLFYQNSAHRTGRTHKSSPNNHRPRLNPYHVEDPFVGKTLDHYDSTRIGGREYQMGRLDASGREILAPTRGLPSIRPADLHLWTPRYRHPLVGTGCSIQDRESVYNPRPLRLDVAAIERRRLNIEGSPSKACTVGSMPDYESHNDRRKMQQIELLKRENEAREIRGQSPLAEDHNLRPSTSQMRLEKSGGETYHRERFEEIQTKEGLFIAAKESSFDWLTSYDCLGLVRPGHTIDGLNIYDDQDKSDSKIIVPGGHESDESDMSDTNSSGSKPIEGPEYPDTRGEELTAEQRATRRENFRKKIDTANANTADAEDSKTALKPKRKTAKEKAEEKKQQFERSKVDAMQMWRTKRAAGYDYEYEAHEFVKPKKKLRTEHQKQITTIWSEATGGRRERHMAQQFPDSSPPSSPPRLREGMYTLQASVPEAISDLDLHSPKPQRCEFDPKCRKWWSHTKPEECWRTNLEDTLYLGDEDEDPILPLVSTVNGENCLLPIARSGREIYRSRLDDHYGRDSNGGMQWPAIGVRVPYAPRTIVENHGLKASVTRSFAVPLIDTPQRPWHMVNEDDPVVEPQRSDEGSETDDDRDKFRMSYQEAVQPTAA